MKCAVLLACLMLGGCETLKESLNHRDQAIHYGIFKVRTIHGRGIYVGVHAEW